MNQYEAMFLFDPTFGGTWENCEGEIRRILGRAEAQIDFCRKWDERKLMYRLKGRKRGVYVLTYFRADASKIAGVERDVQLSENVLRVLVLRADGMTPELMEKASIARTEPAEGEGGDKPYGEFEYREGGDRGRHGRRRSVPRRPDSPAPEPAPTTASS